MDRRPAPGPLRSSRMRKNTQADQKGPDARRRPTAAREAYCLYVERAAEGADLRVVSQFEVMATQSPPIHRAGGVGRAWGKPIRLSRPPPACPVPVHLSRRT